VFSVRVRTDGHGVEKWRRGMNGKMVAGCLKCLVRVGADQIKEDEVGRACSTHERGEKRVQGFGGKERRKETT
jgi:hypothetical protein